MPLDAAPARHARHTRQQPGIRERAAAPLLQILNTPDKISSLFTATSIAETTVFSDPRDTPLPASPSAYATMAGWLAGCLAAWLPSCHLAMLSEVLDGFAAHYGHRPPLALIATTSPGDADGVVEMSTARNERILRTVSSRPEEVGFAGYVLGAPAQHPPSVPCRESLLSLSLSYLVRD